MSTPSVPPQAPTEEAAIAALFKGRLVGNYLAIAEIYDENGSPVLALRKTPGLTVWAELGMLHSVLNNTDIRDIEGWSSDPDDLDDEDDDEI